MAYEREGIVFPMDQDGGTWGSVRPHGIPVVGCCFRCETTERLISLGEDIHPDGYAITIRTEQRYQEPFFRALEEDEFKHLKFKKYPNCPKKKYIYFGTTDSRDSRGKQDGSIMDLMYYLL